MKKIMESFRKIKETASAIPMDKLNETLRIHAAQEEAPAGSIKSIKLDRAMRLNESIELQETGSMSTAPDPVADALEQMALDRGAGSTAQEEAERLYTSEEQDGAQARAALEAYLPDEADRANLAKMSDADILQQLSQLGSDRPAPEEPSIPLDEPPPAVDGRLIGSDGPKDSE